MTENLNALPPGYRLQEYEVLRVVGVGGFGITYLCFDHNLDQARAIKEYLPNDIAIRLGQTTVQCKSTESRGDFEAGLQSFLDEAKRLARFKHDNIVKVHRVFSENGTAYIVMEYAEGETLATVLEQRGRLSEQALKNVLFPILDGLEEVHKVLIHRDIKPGNIIIRDSDDSPVLIDFGSARQAAGSKSRSMTAIVSAGYAPIEQYSTQGNQGPWTDIYALGCLCYRALTAHSPQEAPMRIRKDPVVPLSEQCKGTCDAGFLLAIDWALRVHEEDRPQSIAEWRRALEGGAIAQPAPSATKSTISAANTPTAAPPKQSARIRYAAAALLLTAAAGAAWLYSPGTPAVDTSRDDQTLVTEPDAARTPAQADTEPQATAIPDEARQSALAEDQPATPPAAVDSPPAAGTPAVPAAQQEPATLVANASPRPAIDESGTEFRDRLQSGELGPVMLTLPRGNFVMGSSSGDWDADESPAHTVSISRTIALSKYEITYNDYDRYARDAGISLPEAPSGRGTRPVTNVTWSEAASYALWLGRQTGENYRLPTEAEWEFASQAGSANEYPWGDNIGQNNANCSGCLSSTPESTREAGSFRANRFGLHDMQGNVWEWTQDCARASYIGAPSDGSEWPGDTGCSRVLRGGAWNSEPRQLRSRFRNWRQDNDTDASVGFRLARDVE